jgi:hypothetical protein
MKTKFAEFIIESKTYNLYKGVTRLDEILKSGKLKYDNNWETTIRQNMGIMGIGISATRVFSTALKYGEAIIEFDIEKLSAKYRIIPFSENPDYFIWYKKHFSPPDSYNYVKTGISDNQYNDIFWDYKTNKYDPDFNIAEEIILTKEIPIKYFKKVYLNTDNILLLKLLKSKNIPYEIVDNEHLSEIRHKNKKKNKKNLLDF